MKIWHTLTITVEADAVEAIEFALNSLGSIGTEINFLGRSETDSREIIGYFESLPDSEIVRQEIDYSLGVYSLRPECVRNVKTGVLQEADWLSEWKKHWKPTRTGRFVIAPPWEDIPESQDLVIRIEPNMAFGTGTHETTRLCLASIEKNYFPNETFLDVGTGTGILAIAAAMLALAKPDTERKSATVPAILACDTDADSVKIASENAALNRIDEYIEFREGSIDSRVPRFDFVCANLTADVILPLLPQLLSKTGRFLVLSGILAEQENSMVTALGGLGIENPSINRLGEWISVGVVIPTGN